MRKLYNEVHNSLRYESKGNQEEEIKVFKAKLSLKIALSYCVLSIPLYVLAIIFSLTIGNAEYDKWIIYSFFAHLIWFSAIILILREAQRQNLGKFLTLGTQINMCSCQIIQILYLICLINYSVNFPICYIGCLFGIFMAAFESSFYYKKWYSPAQASITLILGTMWISGSELFLQKLYLLILVFFLSISLFYILEETRNKIFLNIFKLEEEKTRKNDILELISEPIIFVNSNMKITNANLAMKNLIIKYQCANIQEFIGNIYHKSGRTLLQDMRRRMLNMLETKRKKKEVNYKYENEAERLFTEELKKSLNSGDLVIQSPIPSSPRDSVQKGENNRERVRRSRDLRIKFNKLREEEEFTISIEEKDVYWKLQVEKASRAFKNKIIMCLSHDLRTPLHGIQGLLQNLQIYRSGSARGSKYGVGLLPQGTLTSMENIPPTTPRTPYTPHRVIDFISQEKEKLTLPSATTSAENIKTYDLLIMSAAFLSYKVEDMMDFSSMEGGTFELNENYYSIKGIIEELTTLCRHQAEVNGIVLTVIQDSNLPERVYGDKKRLCQVIVHLIQNAIKYTEEGKVIVIVKKRGSQLQFEVRDTGHGMNQDVKRRLFNMLSAANFNPGEIGDTDLNSLNEGGGLGLLITQKICKQMDTTLHFHSQLSQGTRFWFEIDGQIPLVREESLSNLDLLPPPSPIIFNKGTPVRTLRRQMGKQMFVRDTGSPKNEGGVDIGSGGIRPRTRSLLRKEGGLNSKGGNPNSKRRMLKKQDTRNLNNSFYWSTLDGDDVLQNKNSLEQNMYCPASPPSFIEKKRGHRRTSEQNHKRLNKQKLKSSFRTESENKRKEKLGSEKRKQRIESDVNRVTPQSPNYLMIPPSPFLNIRSPKSMADSTMSKINPLLFKKVGALGVKESMESQVDVKSNISKIGDPPEEEDKSKKHPFDVLRERSSKEQLNRCNTPNFRSNLKDIGEQHLVFGNLHTERQTESNSREFKQQIRSLSPIMRKKEHLGCMPDSKPKQRFPSTSPVSNTAEDVAYETFSPTSESHSNSSFTSSDISSSSNSSSSNGSKNRNTQEEVAKEAIVALWVEQDLSNQRVDTSAPRSARQSRRLHVTHSRSKSNVEVDWYIPGEDLIESGELRESEVNEGGILQFGEVRVKKFAAYLPQKDNNNNNTYYNDGNNNTNNNNNMDVIHSSLRLNTRNAPNELSAPNLHNVLYNSSKVNEYVNIYTIKEGDSRRTPKEENEERKQEREINFPRRQSQLKINTKCLSILNTNGNKKEEDIVINAPNMVMVADRRAFQKQSTLAVPMILVNSLEEEKKAQMAKNSLITEESKEEENEGNFLSPSPATSTGIEKRRMFRKCTTVQNLEAPDADEKDKKSSSIKDRPELRRQSSETMIAEKMYPKRHKRKKSESIKEVWALVVDDNGVNRFVIVSILKKLGIKTAEAGNGKRAVELVKRRGKNLKRVKDAGDEEESKLPQFSIIFMDINMPVMDGIEATVQIREMWGNREIPFIKIVAITAFDQEEIRNKCFAVGMQGFLVKPGTKTEIIDIIKVQIGLQLSTSIFRAMVRLK